MEPPFNSDGLTSCVKLVIHLPQPFDVALKLLRLADELGATIDPTDPDGWTMVVPANG